MHTTWRQQQKSKLRTQIYETALRLFRERGYEATSVQEITAELGLAKSTFFNHFPSKEKVVAEWYSQLTEDSLREVEEDRFDSAESAVLALVEAIARRAVNDPDLVDAKSRIVAASSLVSEAERGQDQAASAFFLERLEAGKGSGELAPDLDLELFSGLVIAVLTGTSRAWVQEAHGFDLVSAVRERIAFVFRAARA